jgi:Ca2+-binding RTX toxin-like protein
MKKGMRKRGQVKGQSKRVSARHLRMESLEPKLPLTASLDVVSVGGGPNLRVVGTADNGADVFELKSLGNISGGFDGNVQVTMAVDEIGPDGKFDGVIDFMIVQTFNVPTLQAASAALGGTFLGFQMNGLGGNDKINAKDLKNNEVAEYNGGDGNDEIIGGAQAFERYSGGAGDDMIKNVDYRDVGKTTLPPPNDVVVPPSGFNAIGGFQVDGGAGRNTLNLNGSLGVDYRNTTFSMVLGTKHSDNINSSDFIPFAVDAKGVPTNEGVNVVGDLGNDTLIGSIGRDTLAGGKGDDRLVGGDAADSLLGEEGDDRLLGDAGNDTVDGGDGKDVLRGGDNDDLVLGGIGEDVLFGEGGNDNLQGGNDNDRLSGGAGNDALDGGAGDHDVADYSDAAGAVNVSLAGGSANPDGDGGKDTLVNIEDVTGGAGNDTLVGNGGNNVLIGNDGNDTITGGDGNDDIRGNAGTDTLEGGNGNDMINGGGDNDTIGGGNDNDTILGGSGNDVINGDGNSEALTGNDEIQGEGGDDTITGWNGNDMVSGGDGLDLLRGGFGNDFLAGDKGSDFLDGGRGNDVIEGGFNELATDKVLFEFDRAKDIIVDLVLVGDTAFRDEFIALSDFDDLGEETKDANGNPVQVVNTGDGKLTDGSEFTINERTAVRQQLLSPPSGSNLLFSDYDGGDGPNGDVLSFGQSQLP